MNAYRNVGGLDRMLRSVLGAILFGMGVLGAMPGPVATTLAIVGVVALATGVLGFCPLYRLFGITTCRTTPAHR